MSPLSESCHASPSATTAIQSKKIKEPEAYKFSFWTPSISLMHYAPFSSEKELPSSGGLKIAVGYGQARGRLLWHGNFDIYLGPYGITSEGTEQPVDWVAVDLDLLQCYGGAFAGDWRQPRNSKRWIEQHRQAYRVQSLEDGVVVLQKEGPIHAPLELALDRTLQQSLWSF